MYDFAIIGGGILGLATGAALARRQPAAKIVLLEKEAGWAEHQTGRNSGVIHSGIYYKPGSLKARLARQGSRSMVAFCHKHRIAHEVCGKVIVATERGELPLLDRLLQRGLENGLPVCPMSPEEVQEREPHVRCLAGVHVRTTGIADYRGVCLALARFMAEQGADLRLRTEVRNLLSIPGGQVIETNQGAFKARFLINCAGLHSDRLARLAGLEPGARIVPFRGEYYELRPRSRHLVKHLIYPVPNPDFPFLGVHFTRMIDGSVHAGPNAVLSLKREGYRKTDCNLRDFREVLSYAGFWKLASRYPREGLAEIVRSLNKAAFTRSLQRLIPAVTEQDLVPSQAGVRAQALRPDGSLVDDFLIVRAPAGIHVCNAPSPAATASLEIAEEIAEQVPDLASRTMIAPFAQTPATL